MLPEVEKIFGDPTIQHVLLMLRIAEEELESAGVARTSGCPMFAALEPGELWGTVRSADMWRRHCREKIGRWRAGEKHALDWGTNVEAVLVLLKVALAAPLNRNALATLRLAARGTPAEKFCMDHWLPRWDGQDEQDLEMIRKRIGRT